MTQRANSGNQCNVPLTLTPITSGGELHLFAPDLIDISVGHFVWNGDFNQVSVESDYQRSMLPHLMKGLLWPLGSHYVMLFHAQWYVLPLPQRGGGPLVLTQDELLQLHRAQTTVPCGPDRKFIHSKSWMSYYLYSRLPTKDF